MKTRIALFILSVATMAAFGLFTQAHAHDQTVIVNNYQPQGLFCWGLIGCLVAHALNQQEQHGAQKHPYLCEVWNGRAWVNATCAE